MGINSQLKEKASRLHASPVTPQTLSENWPPRPELIPTLGALLLQARKYKSIQFKYTERKSRNSCPYCKWAPRDSGVIKPIWQTYSHANSVLPFFFYMHLHFSLRFLILYLWHPPSFLRHAVAARGDHGQPRTDGEPAVWAICQQSPELPQPEPRPGCTGDTCAIYGRMQTHEPAWQGTHGRQWDRLFSLHTIYFFPTM